MCNKPERHIPQRPTISVDGGPQALGAPALVKAIPQGRELVIQISPTLGARFDRFSLVLQEPPTAQGAKKRPR